MDHDASMDRYRKAVRAHPELAADLSPVQPNEAAAPVTGAEAGGVVPEIGYFPAKFEIVDRIAETRLSRTWKAWDRERKAYVVIKEARAQLLVDRRAEERFLREVQVAARLTHPNIVPILATHLSEPPWFYTMPLVEGRHLDEFCEDRRLSIGQRLTLFRKVCEAVTHAHQQGVIHRDLKPNNILVCEDGEPQLLDFGLGRLIEMEDSSGLSTGDRVVGSPGYMAPEQAQGLTVGTRTDVYALGVILYELLTRRLPIPYSPDLDEMLWRICERAPTPPRHWNRRLPRELSAIILKALAKRPMQRYQGVHEFVRDIDNCANHRPVDAVRPTTSYVFGKWLRRNRSGLALATAAFLATCAALLFAAISYHHATRGEAERHIRAVLFGRLQTLRDDPVNGSKLLWKEHVAYDTIRTRYALWELYRRYPCALSVVSGPQRDVEYSPSGTWLASVGQDESLSLYDARTGERTVVLEPDTVRARCIKFSPTQAEMYVAGSDGTLRVRRFSDELGQVDASPLRTLDLAGDEPDCLAVSPSGRWLAISAGRSATSDRSKSGDSWVCLWDTGGEFARTQTWQLVGERVHALAFSPDEKTLAGATWRGAASSQGAAGGNVLVWDVSSHETPRRFAQHVSPCRAVAFSRDGNRIFSGANRLKCLDLASGTATVIADKCKWGIRSIAVPSDSASWQLAFAAGDGRVHIYDDERASMSPVQGFHAVVAGHVDVCFSPDGTAAASASSDGLRVWRLSPTSAVSIPRAAKSFGPSLSVSETGEAVAVSGRLDGAKRSLRIWRRGAGRGRLEQSELANTAGKPALSADGWWLAVNRIGDDGASKLVVVDLAAGGHEIAAATLQDDLGVRPEPFWLDSKASVLLLASTDGGLRLWRSATSRADRVSQLEVVHQFDSGCTSVAVDRRRAWLAATSEGPDGLGRVALWRATGRRVAEDPFAAAFALVNEFDTPAYTWNVALLSDDDGELIVATSGSHRDVRLWDPRSGRHLGGLAGHRDAIFHCQALDDNVLVTASRDDTVRIWDIREREEVCVLYESRHEQPVIAVSNGRIVIADGGTIMVADTREIERFITGNRDYEYEQLRRE